MVFLYMENRSNIESGGDNIPRSPIAVDHNEMMLAFLN